MMKQAYADFLLVDVSNSFTKLAFASRARVGRAMRISTAELSTRQLDQFCEKTAREPSLFARLSQKKIARSSKRPETGESSG